MGTITVLFLCTGNSCRSQMAEGFAKSLKAGVIDAYSAGVERHGLDPDAVTVMAEAGMDISGQHSKTVDELPPVRFDYVITLCGHAAENCPFFPGPVKRLHVGFDDPPSLAKDVVDVKARLAPYRRVRDEIRRFAEGMPGNLPGETHP
ncbi:arsenate reductase ArsC [Desulfovibrio sulfodismutans]|uniref:Arsenate reductase ArsC n=1 Tax=Desulfolutivibrio sulfodismutans TaxID=63561 RepID=A0A7K3NP28_9BACT|nr:arsenate reductase ArsC [Desulfolutivibrio sulfodismutans]NDY57593.1 arsenate reductase ArsC [Desulfolutivibrio sulfodismutans]QLA11116.1 arsenate reductase ArsC [Desulfolutivibrio sulfodismutans DSM 3696]